MGDKKTLAMARKELEEMYVGIPDDSVNLSFQELAQVMHTKKPSSSSTMAAISESAPPPEHSPSALAKLPSLDFTRALQHASVPHHHHHHHHHQGGSDLHRPHGHHHGHDPAGFRSPVPMEQRSFTYDDMSHVSAASGGGGRRRRQGIPHSNICTVCSTYIYVFRHRCLVCGRVYCRNCVSIGMGEMKEGRKCTDCLGRRFSQRYINRAGNLGCCLGYPSTLKQQELKWAEKGPRTSGETHFHHRGTVAPAAHHITPPSSPYSHASHHFSPL